MPPRTCGRCWPSAASCLSREQVYRLVTRTPERLSLATLAALCDILGCGPGELIEPVATARAGLQAAATGPPPRPVRARVAGVRTGSAVVARCPAGHELAWPRQRRGCSRCRRDQVVELAAAADRSLPRPVIEAAVEAVAPAGQALRQLAAALAAGPDALSRGAPPVAGRLAAELIARGSAALTIPACAACGRTGLPLFRGDGGGGVCKRCRAWQLAAACASCGKVKPAAGRDSTGQRLCEVCRRRDDPGRRRECGACGRLAPVAVRARDGRPDICVNCYRLPEATCSSCRRRRPCTFAATSQPVCPSCTPRATAACARCGQDRPPQARWPEGPVCDPCYTAALRHRGSCAACGQLRRLVAPPGPAADTCADCAEIPVTCACGDCGIEDKLYEKGRCARCSLRRRAAQLLSPAPGSSPRS